MNVQNALFVKLLFLVAVQNVFLLFLKLFFRLFQNIFFMLLLSGENKLDKIWVVEPLGLDTKMDPSS